MGNRNQAGYYGDTYPVALVCWRGQKNQAGCYGDNRYWQPWWGGRGEGEEGERTIKSRSRGMINSTNVTSKKREQVIKDYEVVWSSRPGLVMDRRHRIGSNRETDKKTLV
jgi:hypothetical protein